MLSKKFKILYVITSLRFGGAEKLVTDLSLRLKGEGNEVEVFVLDGTETPYTRLLESSGILLHKASKGGYYQMWNVWHYRKLKLLFLKNKYDIVHTHNTPAQIIAYLARPKVKEGTKFITTEHNTYNRRRTIPLFKGFDRKMYKFYDKVISVSDATRENLLHYLSISRETEKFVTIYNGIDFSTFSKENVEKPDGYEGKKIILMVAAFRKQKDQPTLMRALKYLPENYVIWFAGEGVRRGRCERLACKLGLDTRVKFLGDRADVDRLYRMADIIVMSSYYEGMSLSSIEALVSGKPFIASNVDGLREVTEGAGLLFERGNEKDLAQKIFSVGESEELSRKISENCRNKAKHFEFETTFCRYKIIYNDSYYGLGPGL